jgi:nicotinamide-nucleotide amidase
MKRPDRRSTAGTCIDKALVTRAERTLRSLARHGLTAVTAESCTAGLVAVALSQAHGAAEQLHGSFVTYTKANKTMALGVPATLLQREGAVNAKVVERLARGALARSPADIALAVSGVLGPEEDEDGNPVGLVYFACCRRGGRCLVERRKYPAWHVERLRRTVVLHALSLLQRCGH